MIGEGFERGGAVDELAGRGRKRGRGRGMEEGIYIDRQRDTEESAREFTGERKKMYTFSSGKAKRMKVRERFTARESEEPIVFLHQLPKCIIPP